MRKNAEEMTAVGEFLKRVRQKNDKTQKEVADQLGLSASVISQWEIGDRSVPHSKITDVACAYGMNKKEESEFFELRSRPASKQSSSEYKVFYGLMMLPKQARERVIMAVRAYESVSKEE